MNKKQDIALVVASAILSLTLAFSLSLYIFSAVYLLPGNDIAMFALISEALLRGHLPYDTFFDHKPIALYYVILPFVWLIDNPHWLAKSTLVCFFVLGAWLLNRSLRGFGILPRLAAVTTLLAIPLGLRGYQVFAETILLALTAGIFLILNHGATTEYKARHFLGAGALFALGFQVNYLFGFIILGVGIGLLIELWLGSRSISRLMKATTIIFVASIATTLVILSPYLVDYMQGGKRLTLYFHQQYAYLTGYSEPLDKSLLLEQLHYWILPFSPILILALYDVHKPEQRFARIFAACVFLSAFLYAVAPKKLFEYYWIMSAVPIAIAAAILLDNAAGSTKKLGLSLCLSIPLGVYLISGLKAVYYDASSKAGHFTTRQAVSAVERLIPSGASSASIDAPVLYAFMHDLSVEQKYIFPGHLEKLSTGGLLDSDQVAASWLQKQPKYLLTGIYTCKDTPISFLETCNTIAHEYREIGYYPTLVTFYGVRVFKRKNVLEEQTAESTN